LPRLSGRGVFVIVGEGVAVTEAAGKLT